MKNRNPDVQLDNGFVPKDDQYDYSHQQNKMKMEQQLKNLQDNIEKRKAEKKLKNRRLMDGVEMGEPKVRRSRPISSPKRQELGFWESLWSKMPFVCTSRNDHSYKYNS